MLIKFEISSTSKLNLELSSNQMQSTTKARRCKSHYATKVRLGFKRRASDESNRVDLLWFTVTMKKSHIQVGAKER